MGCGSSTEKASDKKEAVATTASQIKALELIYFDGEGRGQLSRMAFSLGGIEFKDTRVTFPDWPAIKSNPASLPAQMFGTMPCIEHDGFKIAQSQACSLYAADLTVNKKNTPSADERALDTMLLGAYADLQSACYKCMFGDEESKAKGKEALPGAVAPLLAGIERAYARSGGSFIYSKDGPTLGDLAMLNIVTSPFPGLQALGIDISPYPKLQACVDASKGALEGAASGGVKVFLDKNPQIAQAQFKASKFTGTPELTYFDGPGRGELSRLAFSVGDIDFKQIRHTFDAWPAIKGNPESLPAQMFGTMPCIEHGGLKISQSRACSQYAADLGINKKNNPSDKQRALDNMLLGAHADLQSACYKALFGDEESKAKGKEALPEAVKPLLAGCERAYERSDGPFLYSKEGPTLGDLAIFDIVSSPFPGLLALGVDLSGFPKINACVDACKANPKVKAYCEKRGF
jgi:hypothetical protein